MKAEAGWYTHSVVSRTVVVVLEMSHCNVLELRHIVDVQRLCQSA